MVICPGPVGPLTDLYVAGVDPVPELIQDARRSSGDGIPWAGSAAIPVTALDTRSLALCPEPAPGAAWLPKPRLRLLSKPFSCRQGNGRRLQRQTSLGQLRPLPAPPLSFSLFNSAVRPLTSVTATIQHSQRIIDPNGILAAAAIAEAAGEQIIIRR